MRSCPWCGRPQKWRYQEFQNICPHCNKGVNDWMDVCPWCGEDATGRDLIRQALRRARQLLVVGRLKIGITACCCGREFRRDAPERPIIEISAAT